jgi:hypothetical protein
MAGFLATLAVLLLFKKYFRGPPGPVGPQGYMGPMGPMGYGIQGPMGICDCRCGLKT